MLQDPGGAARVSGTDYYDRLQWDSEFHSSAERHLQNNNVRRRYEAYQAARNLSLDRRRQCLLAMLQAEDRKNRELGHLKLERERLSHREKIKKEASHLKEQLETRERELSDAKLHILFAQSCVPLRCHQMEKNAREIAEERREIAKYVEWDKLQQEKEAKLVEKKKTHFEEQVEREEEEMQVLRQHANDEITNSFNEFVKRIQGKQRKDIGCFEKKKLETNLEQQAVPEDNTDESRRMKDKMLKTMIRDIDAAKKSKEEDRQKGKLVEAFCNKNSTTDCGRGSQNKEILRQEQLRFMQYQKQMTLNEAAYDKCINKLYTDMNTEKRIQEQKRKLEDREKRLAFTKEADEFRKAMVRRKEEHKEAEQKADAEIVRTLQEKLRRENALTLDMENDRHKETKQYGFDLSRQQNYNLSVHKQSKKMELERELKAMTKAEEIYQEQFNDVMSRNPLIQYALPCRRT
ncbi:hypothetical protein FBUS_04783 [Fasciolopsis buskii]|uniref:Trichohyalin-plectin-homology domain-containing protein n=1 Tax=Fasciolopsis buskii TaxID=27845 RepID=A0A8E0RUV1_9TREM|nr:hypothetical protein FBUS_04783 [Fasciolopsis buski]